MPSVPSGMGMNSGSSLSEELFLRASQRRMPRFFLAFTTSAWLFLPASSSARLPLNFEVKEAQRGGEIHGIASFHSPVFSSPLDSEWSWAISLKESLLMIRRVSQGLFQNFCAPTPSSSDC